MGDYFAKQNAHLGAKPPEWRAGSSLPMRKNGKGAAIAAPRTHRYKKRGFFVYKSLQTPKVVFILIAGEISRQGARLLRAQYRTF